MFEVARLSVRASNPFNMCGRFVDAFFAFDIAWPGDQRTPDTHGQSTAHSPRAAWGLGFKRRELLEYL